MIDTDNHVQYRVLFLALTPNQWQQMEHVFVQNIMFILYKLLP